MVANLRSFVPSPAYGRLFEALRHELPGPGEPRARSFARFTELGFPSTRSEAWKYTDLDALAQTAPVAPAVAALTADALAPYRLCGDAHHLVFVNGAFAPELSTTASPRGVAIRTLAEAVIEDARLLVEGDEERSLTALNAALVRDGALVTVAPGHDVGPTIQFLFVDTGAANALINVRNRIEVGAGSILRLAETHVVLAGGGIVNVVNQVDVGDGADLEIDKLVFGGPTSRFFGATSMRIGREAKLGQTTAVAGGALVRNETFARLEGVRGDLDLNGIYMPTAGEHVDTVIRIEHRAPQCESNQFYKGILAEGGRGVFAGKIFVDQVAQKTNAYQQNDNLMLSRNAEIDSKPELEIYADDVKCSHGATVGELDETGLFYLRSRGIGRESAEAILTFAFAGEVVERFVHADSRHQARRELLRRVRGGDGLMELV